MFSPHVLQPWRDESLWAVFTVYEECLPKSRNGRLRLCSLVVSPRIMRPYMRLARRMGFESVLEDIFLIFQLMRDLIECQKLFKLSFSSSQIFPLTPDYMHPQALCLPWPTSAFPWLSSSLCGPPWPFLYLFFPFPGNKLCLSRTPSNHLGIFTTADNMKSHCLFIVLMKVNSVSVYFNFYVISFNFYHNSRWFRCRGSWAVPIHPWPSVPRLNLLT